MYLLLVGDCSRRGCWPLFELDVMELVGVGKGVDGYLGGVDEGVRNTGAAVILSRKASNCLKDKAL